MTPIIGIIDSAKTGNLSSPAMYSIASGIVTSTQMSLDFSSIPQTYTHLRVVCMVRTINSGAVENMNMRVGGSGGVDTGNNYGIGYLVGDSSSANPGSGNQASAQGAAYAGRVAGAGALAGERGICIIDIMNYTDTTRKKVIMSKSGHAENSTNNEVYLSSSEWNNTAAIQTLSVGTFYLTQTLEVGSTVALYGIK